MPARDVKRGRDQNALCGTGWSVLFRNAKQVVIRTAVHSCVRPLGHTGQHTCQCGIRK